MLKSPFNEKSDAQLGLEVVGGEPAYSAISRATKSRASCCAFFLARSSSRIACSFASRAARADAASPGYLFSLTSYCGG